MDPEYIQNDSNVDNNSSSPNVNNTPKKNEEEEQKGVQLDIHKVKRKKKKKFC